jgi:MFS family permease
MIPDGKTNDPPPSWPLSATTARDAGALDPNRWAALAVLLTGAFLAPADFFIVNVALPSITTGLGARAADVQLVISRYAAVFAVFLITGGRLGDMFGRKSIFLAGLAGFALASACCGLAWFPLTLILARLLQALTAAAMAPQALASVHALFPARARGTALGLYGVTIGLASTVGQLLGGVLGDANIAGLGWRLIFLINLPIAVITFIAAIPLLRETRLGPCAPRRRWYRVVQHGACVIRGAADRGARARLALVVYCHAADHADLQRTFPPLRNAPCQAWRRSAGRIRDFPLARPAVGPRRHHDAVRHRNVFLVYAVYLQTALGFTALQAGLAILPFSASFLTGSTASPFVGRWTGPAAPSLGFVLSAGGAIATAVVSTQSPAGTMPPLPPLGFALPAIGLGIGMSIPTLVRVIVERVEPNRAGLVGGIVSSTLQVSSAKGIAVLGGLFYNVLGTQTDPATVTRAFAATLLAIAACRIVGAVLAAGLGQRRSVCRRCAA